MATAKDLEKIHKTLSEVYYSPAGYWRGASAITTLTEATSIDKRVVAAWLRRQAIWQIFQAAPRRVIRPTFTVYKPNEVHQADLLFLPHDKVGNKTFKYALTVVDLASRYKEAEQLT